jgi:cobalt-zinc-cadmium efflux system outer membrane protein
MVPRPKTKPNYVLAALLAAAFLSGCACSGRCKTDFVAAEVVERTGHTLGPELLPCELILPDIANFEDGLSEEEAAAIALWTNPNFRELLADLEITRADLIAAWQLTNPQLSTMFPVSVKQWELTLAVPIDVLLLRPRRVCAAQLEAERVAERLVQDGLNTVRDVRIAYADAKLAASQAELARRMGVRLEELARIAEARLTAGAVSELDIAPFRLEAKIGAERIERTSRDEELALARMRYLLGLALIDQPIILAPETTVVPEAVDAEALVNEAVDSRPDLRAAELATEAAWQRHRLAYFDFLNLNAMLPDINEGGTHGTEVGPGLQLSLPLFHQNQGAKARTAADARRFQWQWVRLRDSAAMEVRQAAARLAQAQQSHRRWHEEILPQAQAAAESSAKALTEDGVQLLVVLESTRQWLTAQQRGLETAADVERALAELERSVGRRLRDRAEAVAEPVP